MYKNNTKEIIQNAQDLQIAFLSQQVSQLIHTVQRLQQENVVLRQQIEKSSLMGKKSRSTSRSRNY
jgi:hypothetical protein